MKICINLSKEEVFAIKDIEFQLQQTEALSRFSSIATLVIPRSHFNVVSNMDAHSTSKYSKAVHCNPTTPITYHENKWESTGFMDNDYVVGVTTMPYPGFGIIISIISKEDNSYLVASGNNPYCTCLDFMKISSCSGKKREMSNCKHLP